MWEQALLSAVGNNCVANRMEGKMVMDRVKMGSRADVWEGEMKLCSVRNWGGIW